MQLCGGIIDLNFHHETVSIPIDIIVVGLVKEDGEIDDVGDTAMI